MFLTAFMNVFVKFVGAVPSPAFGNVVVQSSPKLLPSLTGVGFDITHVAHKKVDNVPGITVYVNSNFPSLTIGTKKRGTLLNVAQITPVTSWVGAVGKQSWG